MVLKSYDLVSAVVSVFCFCYRQDHKADAYQEPVRYDPLNKEHSQYTVADDLSSDSADEEADGKVTRETESKEKPQPEVSKEAFFDVTPSLKNLFGNQVSCHFYNFCSLLYCEEIQLIITVKIIMLNIGK